MEKILILSVGGSPEPIIHAIKNYNPDFVYFFCSSGPKGSERTIDSQGDPCGDTRKSRCSECGYEQYLGNPRGKAIVVQAGLEKEQYRIISIEDPDDLNECYERLLLLTEEIKDKFEHSKVIANYTGGTKTMSVALALVSIVTQQWDLSVNIGPRSDLIKVRSGDVPVVIDKWKIFYQNQLDFFGRLLDNYHYGFVAASISEMLLKPVDKSMRDRLIETRVVCEAFDHWDTFNHAAALELLEPYGSRYSSYIINAKKILKKTKASGYELVSDLLNNAERRAAQKHYDDAIARLYRATELFAQIRLEKEYGLKSKDLRLEDLPEQLQQEYRGRVQNEKLLLGLREDYELLFKLGDPFGKIFKQNEGKVIDSITRRNASISGGHGVTPLQEEDYLFVKEKIVGFIMETVGEIGLNIEMEQLPGREIIQIR